MARIAPLSRPVMRERSWLAARGHPSIERIADTGLPASAPSVARLSPYRRVRDSIAAVGRSVLQSAFVAIAAWASYCHGPAFYRAFRT